MIVAELQAGKAEVKEEIKVALWLLNSTLYTLYKSVRMTLVMSAYSVPFTDELTGKSGPLDLTTLWKAPSVDRAPPTHRARPLREGPPGELFPPVLAPAVLPAEHTPAGQRRDARHGPAHLAPQMGVADHMLEMPIGKDVLLSVNGPAPATAVPLHEPRRHPERQPGDLRRQQRIFGGIFANCEAALNAAVPYVASGTPMPAGTFLPDYNMDSDRGYAWPCWDVDYTYPSKANPFPWNGCDPFPDDTKTRVNLYDSPGRARLGPALAPACDDPAQPCARRPVWQPQEWNCVRERQGAGRHPGSAPQDPHPVPLYHHRHERRGPRPMLRHH